MAITRQKKETLLNATNAAFANVLSIVFVSFKGLTVGDVNDLRATLKKEGVKYTVLKKTLLKKALDAKGYEGTMPDLPGEVAFAYLSTGDDITAPARGLSVFVKKFKEKLGFLGGVLEGKYLSKSEVMTVAAIPAIQVLRGMLVNVINSPIQRLAIALGEVAKLKT